VVADTDTWEQITAKTIEEMPEVFSYVKNSFLNFFIPYSAFGKDSKYQPDFIARVKLPSGKTINLILEITGFNHEKEAKKHFVENRWLPAVNNVLDKYEMDEWHFLEVSNEISDIKNDIRAYLKSVS
jgi:type III restriction enzyme